MNGLKYIGIHELKEKKILGRTDLEQPEIPLFYNGSGVEVNTNSKELWIDIKTDSDFYEPWACTVLNGDVIQRQMLLPGEYSICLFRSMSGDYVKNVRFLRELQAMSGNTKCNLLIKGFWYDGDFFEVEDKPYKLEFIGDSVTSGEGTYGSKNDNEWLPMYMSFSRAYPFLTGEKINAEVRCLSQGGWGMYCSWNHVIECNIPSKYEKICALGSDNEDNVKLGAGKEYDFASWQPDAIILNLGTNDTSGLNTVKNPDGSFNDELSLFIKESTAFLKKLRKHNPNAHILWAFGILGGELTECIKNIIRDYSKETADNNIGFIELDEATEETKGSHGHPGYPDHIKSADKIADYLRAVLK